MYSYDKHISDNWDGPRACCSRYDSSTHPYTTTDNINCDTGPTAAWSFHFICSWRWRCGDGGGGISSQAGYTDADASQGTEAQP